MRVLATITLVGMLSFAGGAGAYVVRPGETLGAIARRLGVPVGALVQANGLRDPDRIYAGQLLAVPGGAPAGGLATAHVVRRGETLASIAARYGVDPDRLALANGIVGGRVYAGARLRLIPLTGPGGRILTGPTVGRGGGVHVVRAGDSLARIARRTGTSVRDLAAANGLRNPNLIRIGSRLTIPGAGGFRCPFDRRVWFQNDWGFSRKGGRAHEGTDLFADRGTPVFAPTSGTVHQVTGARGGLQFTLTGDDGFVYIGSHLHTFGKAGRVAAGDVLGTVGTSGSAAGTPPHLHLEIHPGGIGPVNPYPTLQEACGA